MQIYAKIEEYREMTRKQTKQTNKKKNRDLTVDLLAYLAYLSMKCSW